jgi:hypothetical protein
MDLANSCFWEDVRIVSVTNGSRPFKKRESKKACGASPPRKTATAMGVRSSPTVETQKAAATKHKKVQADNFPMKEEWLTGCSSVR